MAKGWKNESYRHGLASKGIKTVVPKGGPVAKTLDPKEKMYKRVGYVTITFPDMTLNASALREFGVEPTTEFVADYDGDQWYISYPNADEGFYGDDLSDAVLDLIQFLDEDPVVKSVGGAVVEVEEE